MGKAKREGRTRKARREERLRPRGRASPAPSKPHERGWARLRSALDAAPDLLLHPQPPAEPVWKLLWPVLALAFAARAAVALSGDFILHPDELMQYLEQGHRLAFGNGILYWEFFYGARSWLTPALIAGVLKLFDAAGLGQPVWYVGGVKLVFCAISLAIPAGMYFFARRHFDETAARMALLAGAFWYELVGFAHKPLTGFTATAVLMALLALCVRPSPHRPGTAWLAALLAVLAGAIRMQYAPLAVALLGLYFLRAGKGAAPTPPGPMTAFSRKGTTPGVGATPGEGGTPGKGVAPGKGVTGARTQLVLASGMFFLAVGVFDALTWDGGLFHSYLTNVRFNVTLSGVGGSSDSPAYQYLWWLALAGAGLSALCVAAALRDLRRYGFLLSLVALVLILHSAQAHKEYRFIFSVIPLWLLVGADVVARLATPAALASTATPAALDAHAAGTGRRPVRVYAVVAGAVFAGVSLAGILNALPWQHRVYEGAYTPRGIVIRFIRGQDPVFRAYRHLAEAPGVDGVWHVDRHYHSLPGYYYLHRKIPFYDVATGYGNEIHKDPETIRASASHLVSGDPDVSVPGYTLEKAFGGIRILRREGNEPPIRRWRDFTPTITGELDHRLMRRIDPGAPSPPANLGIRFAEPE